MHGFTSMLVYLIREHHPSALAVAFDAPGATFRDEILEDYKAGRAETPWLLPPQFDMIREVMAALAIPVVEAPGFEADDVLATLATEARGAPDARWSSSPGTATASSSCRTPTCACSTTSAASATTRSTTRQGIFDRTGVPPSQYVMLASLRGDPSDNLPGIPGVGEKTAAKLLTKYGDLDGIFSHLDEQTPKLRENLAENEELARSNARIIPLVRDVPARRPRRPPDPGRLGPGHRRGHVRALRDEDGVEPAGGAARRRALGEPVPGSAGPVRPRAPRR